MTFILYNNKFIVTSISYMSITIPHYKYVIHIVYANFSKNFKLSF